MHNHYLNILVQFKILNRGANGIVICYDDNIVIKISKNSLTRKDIIDGEVINMIELYNSSNSYNFRDENLVKLLGVVYVNEQKNIITKFDESRTHSISNFNPIIDKITDQDRIGFVIMEKYNGTLSEINFTNVNMKLDIINQMLKQLQYFFNKGYYHTDLHDENWFYKMVNGKYVMRISDYGSEIKSRDEKIGVFKLSDESSEQNKQKCSSLTNLALGLAQKYLISNELFLSLLDMEYNDLKHKLWEIINDEYKSTASTDSANILLLDEIKNVLTTGNYL